MTSNPLSKLALYLSFITTLVLLSAWSFLIYKSTTIKSDLVTIETEAKEKSSESTYSSTVRNILRESKNDVETLNNRFISKDEVPEFISILETQAENTNVNVNLGGIEVISGTPFSTLQVKIAGTGTWNNIVRFSTTLDSLPYMSRINSLSFSKRGSGSTEENATTTWGFNIDFVQYLNE